MKTSLIILILLLVSVQVNALKYEDVLERQDQDYKIDYYNRYVTVTSIGASTIKQKSIAEKKVWAATEARKNCYTRAAIAIGNVRFSGKTLFESGRLKESKAALRIRNFVRGLSNIKESYEELDDGSILAKVTIVINFDGSQGLNNILFNDVLYSENNESIASKDFSEFEKEYPVTGIIFDVRDLTIEPSLAPVIYSENGEIIYSAGNVSRDYAVKYGIAGYTRNIDRAVDRIGTNPVVIKVNSLKPEDRTSIVLSKSEEKKLKMLDDKNKILKRCKVVFLVK